jgi:hypothetical protein
MRENLPRQTAKIYQFPICARKAGIGGHSMEAKGAKAADAGFPCTSGIVLGEAWYHDVAIQEAARTER